MLLWRGVHGFFVKFQACLKQIHAFLKHKIPNAECGLKISGNFF